MGCHFLLQGIFPTQGSNPGPLRLLHWQADSLSLCHLGSTAKLNYVLTDFLPAEFTHFAKGILKSLITMIDSFISPGDLPDPGIEPASLASPALAGRFFTAALDVEVKWPLLFIIALL